MAQTRKERADKKKIPGVLREHWAAVTAALFVLAAGLVYLAAGDGAQIAVADNLDLFQAQYRMLKNTGTFRASGAAAPFLHGISRDVLPSECSLEAVLYLLLPSLAAYVVMYLVKVVLGTVSFVLLARELERRGWITPGQTAPVQTAPGQTMTGQTASHRASRTGNLAVLIGLCYGCLNLFPSFGIAFSSIPLAVYCTLRLLRAESRKSTCGWLLALFLYPWLSYFSYFGFFLLCYLVLALTVVLLTMAADVVRCRIRGSRAARSLLGRRRTAFRLLLALLFLSAGYVVWEHRLFASMLLGGETTIRDTMVQTSLTLPEILQWTGGLLLYGVDLHCESAQRFVVLPVCLVYLILRNAGYLRRREGRAAFRDLYNIAAILLLFNSAVYGLYYCEGFRTWMERLVPSLRGFQFSRTSFFNPFLWYVMFWIALCRLTAWGSGLRTRRKEKNGKEEGSGKGNGTRAFAFAVCLAAAAFLAIQLYGNTYNDLLHTAKALVKEELGKEPDNTLSYGEFYSEALFRKACEEIGYEGEWSAAYGFHPAVLEYNGIATIDGYLGFYPQAYKESFRRVIAPALEQNESSRLYYDEWGARCYLYSGSNATIVEAVRNYPHTEDTLEVDTAALRELDCRYIFSRIAITNYEELSMELLGPFTEESSPYTLYVYRLR